MKKEHVQMTLIVSCAFIVTIWLTGAKEIRTSMITISEQTINNDSLNTGAKPVFKNEFYTFILELIDRIIIDGFWFFIILFIIPNIRKILIAQPARNATMSFRWLTIRFWTDTIFGSEKNQEIIPTSDALKHENCREVLHDHQTMNPQPQLKAPNQQSNVNQTHYNSGNYRNKKKKKGR